MIKIIAITAE